MKRIVSLFLLLMLAAGCSAGGRNSPVDLNREDMLPEKFVTDTAGVPMKLAYDSRDAKSGVIRWAWEETSGLPKLITIDLYTTPADCGILYSQAEAGQGCVAFPAPDGASACYDGRAVHMQLCDYYVRIAVLGCYKEKQILEQIAEQLASAVTSTE
jgi:hypothetical protein